MNTLLYITDPQYLLLELRHYTGYRARKRVSPREPIFCITTQGRLFHVALLQLVGGQLLC